MAPQSALSTPVSVSAGVAWATMACEAARLDLHSDDVDDVTAWVADVLPPVVLDELGDLRAFVVSVLARHDAAGELPRRTVQ